MRYTAELVARAAAWLARDGQSTGPDGRRSDEGLLELATVWAAIQSVPVPACIRQCQYSERARDVAAYVREFSQLSLSPSVMSDNQTTSKYQIAPAYAGQTFVHEDWGKAVTGDNLTDEDAEFFIGKGRSDAFTKRDSTSAATENPAGEKPVEVVTENPVVPQTDLDAEKEAHAATKQKSSDALAAEKEAHAATKGKLKEANKQAADLQKQLEKLTKEVEKAADGIAAATKPEVDAAE